MSFKTSIIKMAIKWTPNRMVVWVANKILKGIAELIEFNFDLEARRVFVQIQLCGEAEAIDVQLDGFAIINEDGAYKFILEHAQSNRLWMNNILARIVGRAWKIPVLPQFAAHIALVAEVFKAETPALAVE